MDKKKYETVPFDGKGVFSLLDNLPAFVYLQAPDYSIRFANATFCNTFGNPKGLPCYEVIWKAQKPCERCPTFRVFNSQKPQVWISAPLPNGRLYQVYDYPFSDLDGSPLVLEMGIDITARLEMEEKIHQSHDELERRVAEKTAQLSVANEALKRKILEHKKTEKHLLKKESELMAQSRHLREANLALEVLLRKREEDRHSFHENIFFHVKHIVLPYIMRLKDCRLNQNQRELVNILESNLNKIVSPLKGKLSSKYHQLTPMEIRVADLIKEGKANKEMANLLGVSLSTILTHRHHLREKLNLKHTKTNLRSYLLSLQY